jgi:hypothetical protein
MSDPYFSDPDQLARLLAPPSLPAEDPLRQSLFLRTRQRLRWRSRLRRLSTAAALVLCYLAGLGTTQLVPPDPGSDGRAGGVNPPVATLPPSAPSAPAKSARQREWEAVDSTTQTGQLYHQAGDQYLAEEADPLSALRCYGNALDAGADLTPSPTDSGLLMVIKLARSKENRHAIP